MKCIVNNTVTVKKEPTKAEKGQLKKASEIRRQETWQKFDDFMCYIDWAMNNELHRGSEAKWDDNDDLDLINKIMSGLESVSKSIDE